MNQLSHDAHTRLSRPGAWDAVAGIGWRFVQGGFRTQVLTGSLPLAADVAARAAAVAGAEGHLRMDVRADRVLLSLQTAEIGWVTPLDVELAHRVSIMVDEFLLETASGAGADDGGDGVDGGADTQGADIQGADIQGAGIQGADIQGAGIQGAGTRSVQVIEIAIDALDIAAIRPFWKAVLGYADEPGRSGPRDPLADPLGEGPAIWFQQMDAARPQRNRIHFDVSVPHDEARRRIAAAVAAGGTLIYDAEAPAFWVLADPEGSAIFSA